MTTGQKQAGRVWNNYLIEKLESIGFQQSEHDECVLYRGKVIYVLYTDDTIITATNNKLIDDMVKDIEKAGLKVTDEGNIEDFLGVNITRMDDNSIHLHQPHLIDQILKDLNIQENASIKDTPAKSSTILSRHSISTPHVQYPNLCSGYIFSMTRHNYASKYYYVCFNLESREAHRNHLP